MEGHFSREDFIGVDYRWANPESKRIKFFVYSTHKYREKKKFDKYLLPDLQEDVDVCRMKNEFIAHHIQEDADAVYKINCTREDFGRQLEEMKEDSDLNNYDCLFFMFFTFISIGTPNESKSGVEQESLHFRNGLIPIHDIWEKVRDIKQFSGKPKVFFIQADDCTLMFPEEKSKGSEKVNFETKRIPIDADRLIIQSTIPRKATCKGKTDPEGSFLVEAFIEVMRDNRERQEGEKMDLLSLTIDINRNVRRKIKDRRLDKNFPYPQISSTFTKFLYL